MREIMTKDSCASYAKTIEESLLTSKFQHRYLRRSIKLINEFLAAKKIEGCSKTTRNAYKRFLYSFVYIMEKDVVDVTTADIREFLLQYQQVRDVSGRTIDGLRRYLSSFYNFLEEEYYIDTSPVRRIHKIKYTQTVQKPFLEEDVVRMEYGCHCPRDQAIVGFLNSTGVRVGELVRLDIADINMREMECIVYGKGAKERFVYFDPRTRILLQEYLDSRTDDCPALFITDGPVTKRLTKSGVEFLIRELGEELGIEKCHPHRFRRTFATRMLNRGMPIEQVQKLLGHARIETTLIYTEISQENVKTSYKKFSL